MSATLPTSIGPFKILSKLGQGGMGSVYLALHGTLQRTVALKVLPPEFSAHPEYISRFMREARVIAGLRHENIIHIYDSGEINGQYYIAMEHVDGGNLLNVADARTKIGEKEGLGLMLQAARGLLVAHAKGLIHRDIKPENLLLGTDGRIRLVDFGLVADSGSDTQLTQAGTCLGTPMYMSPEQADGEPTDARSDLYALGASFFRVFTGRPPFISGTVMNTLFKQKFEKPPEPRALRPDLSQSTSDLLLHLLAKRREDRPADAQALMAMIEQVLAGKTIPPPPAFVPLAPKPRAEEAVPSVSADGETALLFAGSGTLRRQPAENGAASSIKAALIFFAFSAAVLIFIASRARHGSGQQNHADSVSAAAEGSSPNESVNSGIAGNTGTKPPPVLSESALLERVALGDAAFRDGRVTEARAIYLDALKSVPNHIELIKRRDRADRRIKFDLDMLAAEKFERDGKLEDALTRYGEAQALDEEHAAQERIERVKAALELQRKPVAEFSAAPKPPEPPENDKLALEKSRELERAAKSAQDFLLLQNYQQAEASFSRAAELAPEPRKSAFIKQSLACRRLALITQARAAEAKNEFAQAETALLNALELASDEQTIAQLKALREKMTPPQDKQLALFNEAMREGQEAIDKGDFKTARVRFGGAMALKPEISSPVSKLNEIDARETVLLGDDARDHGELENARKLYQQAQLKSPLVERDVELRLEQLDKAPSRATLALDKACALAKEHKDDEALKVLDEALKLDPQNAGLKEARTALESARKAEELLEALKNIQTLALQRLKEAAAIDDDDSTKKMSKAIADALTGVNAKKGHPLSAFAAHDFKAPAGELAEARTAASECATELSKAAEFYAHLSEKSDDKVGVKIPGLPKIGIGGDRKKSEKYKSLVQALKLLLNQGKELQK